MICDSGPLTHLWQIGLWPAFEIFNETHLPVQVANEVQQHVDLDQLKNFTRLQLHTISPIQIETAQQVQPQDIRLQLMFKGFWDLSNDFLGSQLLHTRTRRDPEPDR